MEILLYYVIAIDNTIFLALNNIAAEQSVATENTQYKVTKLLNYPVTTPDSVIHYEIVIDNNIFVSVSKISAEQSVTTANTQ